MLGGIFQSISDFFLGIFAVIPQTFYFLYTCIASLLDFLQFVVRKLAGLDGYYVNGSYENGDILTKFITGILGINGNYSVLNTVFWALIIFGVIIMVLSVIISIIKAHYNYDESKSRPTKIIGQALKGIATCAIVPIVTVFGLYLSNYLLKALDTITAPRSNLDITDVYKNSESNNVNSTFKVYNDEWGSTTFSSYDIFGFAYPTGTQSFSGLMFKIAARDANRVRYGSFTASRAGEFWSDLGIFNSSLDDHDAQIEDVANMIDFAFENNLTLNSAQLASVAPWRPEAFALIPSYRYFQSKVWYLGTIGFRNFSRFNVGLVWYYYNLWSFNYLLGFIGIIFALTLMTNIVFGLIVRIVEATALFMCLGPLCGLMPLDGGEGFKSWRKEFVGDILMAYGAIVGMNLLFLLLPYLQRITFLANAPLINSIISMIVTIVALMAVKQLIQMLSNFVGGKDAFSTGQETKKEAGAAAAKGAVAAGKVVKVGVKAAKFIPGVAAAAKAADEAIKQIQKIKEARAKQKREKAAADENVRISEETNRRLVEEEKERLENEKSDLESQREQAEQEYHDQQELAEQDTAEGNKNLAHAQKEEAKADKQGGLADKTTEKADEKQAEADVESEAAEEDEKNAESERGLAAEAEGKAEEAIGKFKRARTNKSKLKHLNDFLKYGDEADEHAKKADNYDVSARYHRANAADIQKEADEYKKRVEHYREQERLRRSNADAQTRAAQASYSSAQSHQDAADAARQRIEKIEQQLAQNEARMQQVSAEGFTMEGYEVQKHSAAKHILKVAGQTFKAAGTAIGLDQEIMKKIDDETGLVDLSKDIIREFAQQTGMLKLAQSRKLATKSQIEEIENSVEEDERIRGKVTYPSAQNMTHQIKQLTIELRQMKQREKTEAEKARLKAESASRAKKNQR